MGPCGPLLAWSANSRHVHRSPEDRSQAPPIRLAAEIDRARQGGGSAAPGTEKPQTNAETGLPGTPSTCMTPSRPCISGRPGRSASRQNDKLHAFGGERLLHKIVIADRRAAAGDENIGVELARAADRATVASSWSPTMPRSVTSAPSLACRAPRTAKVLEETIWPGPVARRAAPVRRPSQTARLSAAGVPGRADDSSPRRAPGRAP